MRNGEIKVAIDAQIFGGVNIYIGRGMMGNLEVAKPIELDFQPIPRNESYPATLFLGEHLAYDLLKALAEALDERGIKTEKDAKVEGKLEATQYHLEDMRKLLKLK